jgi:hypothetical protein
MKMQDGNTAGTFSLAKRLTGLGLAFAIACVLLGLGARSAPAAFEVTKFDGGITRDALGEPATQAGSHPYAIRTDIEFATKEGVNGGLTVDGNFKDIETILPPGLIGNPNGVAHCSLADYYRTLRESEIPSCPLASVIGYLDVNDGTQSPVYNLIPPEGKPAMFGTHVLAVDVFMEPSIRTGAGYGVEVRIPNAPQALPVSSSELILWGVPGDPSHDPDRGACLAAHGPDFCPVEADPAPFLTMPTSCGGPMTTTLRVNSWQEPENWIEASFQSHDRKGNPVGVEGCEKLNFEPAFDVQLSSPGAGSPSGLRVHVRLPQGESAEDPTTSHLKKAVVTLPEGMTVNAAAANGRGACSPEEIDLDSSAPVACPASSRIGLVELATPLLENPMEGSVYLAEQGDNPFGSTLAAYIVVEGEGALIKLPGKIDADPQTGRLTATFDDNPQLPFTDLMIDFFGGQNAALVSPKACGTYAVVAELTPWSGTGTVTRTSSFTVASGPNGGPCPSGGFDPKLSAGTVNPIGGSFSPFLLQLSREDGMADMTGLDISLPPGLLGKLAGVPYCPDAALAGIPTGEGSGAAQIAGSSCPAASQVGTVGVGAGAGSNPVYVNTGKAYLAGPYKGAPLSLAVVTPAVAGPFDLGNVVVRTALYVNPATTQVRAVSDPLPTILAGIPLNLRDVRVNLDRDGFTLNPTSCDPMSVAGHISGAGGIAAAVWQRFQAASCAGLGFKPRLSVRFSGPTHRGAHPKLKAVLAPRPGDANLEKAVVTLPETEFLENSHIRTICTRPQYAADQCPAASVYGYAKAWTRLLDQPLQGPVYLRSSDNKLPDLVASLDGQIHLDLPGRIDSVDSRIRATFRGLPDAPVSKFVLTMQGGKKGLLVNNTQLCGIKPRISVGFDGQNGKIHHAGPIVKTGCEGARKRR